MEIQPMHQYSRTQLNSYNKHLSNSTNIIFTCIFNYRHLHITLIFQVNSFFLFIQIEFCTWKKHFSVIDKFPFKNGNFSMKMKITWKIFFNHVTFMLLCFSFCYSFSLQRLDNTLNRQEIKIIFSFYYFVSSTDIKKNVYESEFFKSEYEKMFYSFISTIRFSLKEARGWKKNLKVISNCI